MKKLLFLLLFIPAFGYSGGPNYQHKDPAIQQEFEFSYQEITKSKNLSLSLSSATATYLTKSSATATYLRTFGPNIIVSAAGEVTQPLQPSFLAWLDVDALNVTGDGTEINPTFDTEDYDLGADYTLASGVFTAPISGVYQFNASVDLQNIAGFTGKYLRITTSNHNYFDAEEDAGGFVEERHTMHASVTCWMDVNDTATAVVYVSGGAKSVDINGGNTTSIVTYFSGSLIN